MSDKTRITNLPSPSVGGLSLYLAQIKKFPMLDAEEEYMLAKSWKERGNLKAAHKLNDNHDPEYNFLIYCVSLRV